MAINIPIQLLLVQLANMQVDPSNYNINFTKASNDPTLGVLYITKDQLLDAKKMQDLETENHMLSTQLNMTEVFLHRAEEINGKLRHEQIRNRVKKILLRNVTSQYIKTKKELETKLTRLAQVETTLNIYEKELSRIKQESETWRHKCEQYESKLLPLMEDQLKKKAAKLQNNNIEVEIIKETCKGDCCEQEEMKTICMEDTWCCWLEKTFGSMHDNEVETTATENDENRCKEISLIEASKMNNVTIISELLKNKTNVQTFSAKSPLHWATENGHYNACNLLVGHGADINARDPLHYNSTPVHVAAELGQISILELFLQEPDVDIDAKDADGWTPLHWAVTFNKTDAVVLLLNENADVNATNDDGESPLHHAALSGYPQIVKILVDGNADVNARDSEGRTPLHFATLSSHYNASSNDSLQSHSMTNISAFGSNPCKMLHKYPTPLESKDSSFYNNSLPVKVLSLCLAEHDCTEIANILLQHGANVSAKDIRGKTPSDDAPKKCQPILNTYIHQYKEVNSTTQIS